LGQKVRSPTETVRNRAHSAGAAEKEFNIGFLYDRNDDPLAGSEWLLLARVSKLQDTNSRSVHARYYREMV
jgi:hypothetical protein